MLLHASAAAALRRHAAEDGGAARGWLVGVQHGAPPRCVVLSACRRAADCADLAADLADVAAQLPAPLRVLGPYSAAAGDARAACARECGALRGGAELVAAASAEDAAPHRFFNAASGEALPATPAPDAWLQDTFAVLRCRVVVRLPADGDEAAARDAAEQLCGADVAWLAHAAGGARHLLPPSAAASSDGPRVADVASPGAPPAAVTPLARSGAGDAPAAPRLTWQVGPARAAPATLHVLLYADPAQPLAAALHGRPLADALRAQIAAASAALRGAPAGACEPSATLFAPPGLAHPFAAMYALPAGGGDVSTGADVALAPARAALHARWGLPRDAPLLRLCRALPPSGPLAAATLPDGGRLRDPHLLAPPSGVPGATAHTVRGSYLYFHYGQDRFDDAGWGCAYRSCQTLVSWMRLQGHVAAPVPSHGDIQRVLVQMGDKEPKFVGSRQWIGAIELMYVLMASYDVECKMLAVPAGADVAEHVRALAAHFDAQGTPVMIGGGVLAYTLLGVDWNEATGEAAFLILDPHYIGAEDAAAIVPAWCGWRRAADVFVPDAFYNFLCPQRPTAI